MANMEWEIENTPDTKHRLGSITKQFTAMLILQLAAEGKLDLHAPIDNYLPDYPNDHNPKITTHHLLTHTSGIPNYMSFPRFMQNKNGDPYAPDDFLKIKEQSAENLSTYYSVLQLVAGQYNQTEMFEENIKYELKKNFYNQNEPYYKNLEALVKVFSNK